MLRMNFHRIRLVPIRNRQGRKTDRIAMETLERAKALLQTADARSGGRSVYDHLTELLMVSCRGGCGDGDGRCLGRSR
jgi:hypothetical protein